jgi:uncharacterized protein YcgI (DUF1989 family)
MQGDPTMPTEVLIKAGHGGRVELRVGQFLEILNVEGQQICDFFAFNQQNRHEHLSPSHTRSVLGRVYVQRGDVLSTVLRRPMLEIVEDTCGQHDLSIPACDPQRYLIDYGLREHRSCRMNLAEMMTPEAIPYEYLPDPVNFFQSTRILADGRYTRDVSPSCAGDKVMLRALMDVIAVGSACPQDRTGGNGELITDIKLIVH